MAEGDVVHKKTRTETSTKSAEAPRPPAAAEEDYDLYELSEEGKVVVDQDYQKQVDWLKNMPEKVVVDQGYLASPEHHKDKVVIDPAYNEAIREESPEDYIPELPSELLQEIEGSPEDEGAKERALVFEKELQGIAAARQAERGPLEAYREEVKKSIALKKGKADPERKKLAELDRQIALIDRKYDHENDLAARKMELKAVEDSETYDDPERAAAAIKRYEAACASIEDDYEGDMAEARAEYDQLYGEYLKMKSNFPYLQRMGSAKRLFEVTLPALREKRLEEANRVFQDDMTPTVFDQNLFELTVAFEKKATRVQNAIDDLQADIKRLEKFPEAQTGMRQRINALNREAQHVAAQYSRDVDNLKRNEEERKRKKNFSDALSQRSEKRSSAKETAPPEQVALSFLREIRSLVDEVGPDADKKEGAAAAVENSLADAKRDVQTEAARIHLETAVLGDEEGEFDAEERSLIAKDHEKRCKHIAAEFEAKVSEKMKEFSPLYDRVIKDTFSSDEEKAEVRKQLAEVRYAIDVKLETERKTELLKARQAYERAITPTVYEKELFTATVRFERQALGIEDQKKNIRAMMGLVEEYPDAVQRYQEILKKLDDEMKALAKKYNDEIDILKKEQKILAAKPVKKNAQSSKKTPVQSSYKKAA